MTKKSTFTAGTEHIGIDLAAPDFSILSKNHHHASTIYPEILALFRNYWKGKAALLMRNKYAKDTDLAVRGKLTSTTGYSDWLWAQQQLFMIDIGFNGGRRAFKEFRFCSWHNFAPVYWPTGKALGLWNVEGFVQKTTSAGARSPFFILDAGVNFGVVRRFLTLKSNRGTGLTDGTTHDRKLFFICVISPHFYSP